MNKRNWLTFSGLVYVLVWVIGLLIPTGSLSASPSNTEIQQVLVAHQLARSIQVYLIDGIAGVSILLFAVMAANLFQYTDEKNSPIVSVVMGAGIAAGSISLIQAGVQQALVNSELLTSADAPLHTLLVLVNQIDTFKLMALALLSVSTSILVLRSRLISVWIGWLGIILAVALILGGLSFAIASPLLTGILFASLPMLLVWVGGISVAGGRQVK